MTVALPARAAGNDVEIVNPHMVGDAMLCFECHTADIPRLKRAHVATCTRCHRGNISDHPVVGHPLDRPVFIHDPVPPLPLTSDKRIVCTTCHDPHEDTGFKSLLRVQLRGLCVQCHRGY